MPTSVLVLLSTVVGAYVLLAGAAAWTFHRARRAAFSTDQSDEPPFVSVVIPVRSSDVALDDLLDTLQTSGYPADRYEVLVASSDPTLRSRLESARSTDRDPEPALRFIETNGSPDTPRQSDRIAERASGDVLVTLPTTASVPTTWLAAVAANAPSTAHQLTPAVTYEHNDRFLPRLQALEQVGRTGATLGAGAGAPHTSTPGHTENAGSTPLTVARTGASEAQIRRPAPAASLGEYVEATARRFLNTFRHANGRARLAEALYGATHASLLIAGAVAVALPAWRQPVLLAFLAKMGGDLLLAVPAARHFGQRGLLRSVVPTELFLVLAVPAAGALSIWTSLRESASSD